MFCVDTVIRYSGHVADLETSFAHGVLQGEVATTHHEPRHLQ